MAINVSNVIKVRESSSDPWERTLIMADVEGLVTAEVTPISGSEPSDFILSVANGGTGGATAASARQNIGAVSATEIESGSSNPFILGVSEGGTGASTAADARTNLSACVAPTWMYVEETTTANSTQSYSYSVSGNGFIVANDYIRSDTTSDTGTATAAINHITLDGTEWARGWSVSRFQTAQSLELGTNTAAVFMVFDGEQVIFNLGCTKNGSKRIRYSVMMFGCTLTKI